MQNMNLSYQALGQMLSTYGKREGECLIWDGPGNRVPGSGVQIGSPLAEGDTRRLVHHLAYAASIGRDFPRGYHVYHTCGEYLCFEPTHLKPSGSLRAYLEQQEEQEILSSVPTEILSEAPVSTEPLPDTPVPAQAIVRDGRILLDLPFDNEAVSCSFSLEQFSLSVDLRSVPLSLAHQ